MDDGGGEAQVAEAACVTGCFQGPQGTAAYWPAVLARIAAAAVEVGSPSPGLFSVLIRVFLSLLHIIQQREAVFTSHLGQTHNSGHFASWFMKASATITAVQPFSSDPAATTLVMQRQAPEMPSCAVTLAKPTQASFQPAAATF
jgi:hypothetical protein